MIQFFRQYIAWNRMRRDLFSGWMEKHSRISTMLEIERHQKEIFFLDAEIDAKRVVRESVKTDLLMAQEKLRQIEAWNG